MFSIIRRPALVLLLLTLGLCLATCAGALAQGDFDAWLAAFKAEVHAKGIS